MTNYVGTSGADIFTGTPNEDQAEGMGGNDSLSGGPDFDILAGNAGRDTLNGGGYTDILYAGDISGEYKLPYYGYDYVAPTLDTGTEIDTLNGGEGGDLLFAGYGDNVDGGEGFDTLFISFLGASQGVTADFHLASQIIGGGLIQNVEAVSWVQGSNFDDTIFAEGTQRTSDNTAVFGMGGNDHLVTGYYTGAMFGGDGNDRLDGEAGLYLGLLDGGDGNDTIIGSTSFADIQGGAGDDVIETTERADGGAGNDQITVRYTNYLGEIYGGAGDDTITGSYTEHHFVGGAGADVLTGNEVGDTLAAGDWVRDWEGGYIGPAEDTAADRDRLSGGAGNDVLWFGYGDDADGGAGTDILALNLGGASSGVTVAVNRLTGASPYTLAGGVIQNFEYVDHLTGSAFGDVFQMTTPVTMTIDGAGGIDTLDMSGFNSAATVTLGAGVDAVGVGPAGGELRHVENLTGSRYGDSFRGSDGANLFSGGDGSDKLYGAGGDDTLDGGAGTDILQGGAGNDLMLGGSGVDTASYSAATAGVTVNLGYTTAQATGGAGVDTLQGIEGLGGSAFADVLTGSTGANTLSGLAGDDRLVGGKGNDLLDGGDGADLLVGGLGDDKLSGGAGSDIASYVDATAGVSVDLAVTTAQATGGAGLDTLTGIEGLVGSGFNDSLRGDAAANVIDTGAGDDLAWGFDGSDRIAGGLGRDKLWGGNGADRLDGGDGNDVLRGGEGSDRIGGDAGIDLLYGDGGIDVLTGGTGADRFVYSATTDAVATGDLRERITDFSHAEGDRIDLTAIDAVAGGGDNAFAFVAGGAFTGAAGQLIVTHAGADWFVQGDVNGDKLADFAIQVTSATALVAGDFLL